MNNCEKFNEILLPEKEDFYNHCDLNMEDITGADYTHAKRVCKDFFKKKKKKIGEYHDLYVQSDILSLADVLENFQNMSWKILADPAWFLTAPGSISMASSLKKD